MCSNYIDIIDTLRTDKEAIEKDLSQKYYKYHDLYQSLSTEFSSLTQKSANYHKDLLTKLESEGVLKSQVEQLKGEVGRLEMRILEIVKKNPVIEELQETVG